MFILCMAKEMKIPFHIKDIDDRKIVIEKMVKFGKVSTKIIKKEKLFHKSLGNVIEYYSKTNCPCCDWSDNNISMKCPKDTKDNWYKFNKGNLPNERYYRIASELFNHAKYKIRINGCKKHMQLVLDIFGNNIGIEILNMFVKKNREVVKSINEFINSKKLSN